jgi:wyosine [tRNA(Phe)-imidazoG37] synthetase (radical SAM superfamily)
LKKKNKIKIKNIKCLPIKNCFNNTIFCNLGRLTRKRKKKREEFKKRRRLRRKERKKKKERKRKNR